MPISSAALQELLKVESSDPVLLLATLHHPMLNTLYFVRNQHGKDITSRGQTFTAIPFQVILPNDNDEVPAVEFAFPNVDRTIGWNLLNVNTPINVILEAVLNSNPDDILRRYPWLEMRNVTFDQMTVRGELTHMRFTSEPYPNIRVNPNRFPVFFS